MSDTSVNTTGSHQPASHRRRWRRALSAAWWLAGVRRYGVGFVLEVIIFYAALQAFQALGYGGRVGTLDVLSLGILIVAAAMAVGEATFRLYRRVWAVAGLTDAIAIGLAVAEASLLVALANALIPAPRPYRLLVPILAAPTVAAAIAVFRLLPRILSSVPRAANRLLVVVFGSQEYGTIKAMIQHPNPDWSPVAVLTDDPAEMGKTIMGVPVVGNTRDMKRWMDEAQADGVAFVVSRDTGVNLHDLFSICLAAELPIFIVPGPSEWLNDLNGARLRQLTADDLVGRAQHELEAEQAAELIAGRTVLVTGAAGSIGAELARTLAKLNPRRLVLLDNNETGLFDICEELRAESAVDIRNALVSITDHELLLPVFVDERPEIVFHAAAYKHVPMLETRPEQAVLTNVIGTQNALRCADAVGVQKFLLISTDKAVAQHSVMGCTKRLCELLVMSHRGPMVCWAVRFGNVVGSRGSVVPIFERQIRMGGPVTITHPDASRYLMTIREAVALVVSTVRFAGPSQLYMLDMGEPIKIVSLAKALIRSRGLRPGVDIKIVFTGLRPGERLHEELLLPEEGLRRTPHGAIRQVVSASPLEEDLGWTLTRLQDLARQNKTDELTRVLKRSVLVSRAATRDDEPAMTSGEAAAEPVAEGADDT